MVSFPSSRERTAATSLLLLHTTTSPSPSFCTPKFSSERSSSNSERFRDSPALSGSDYSSASSVTNDNGVSFLSATARYRRMKFKIARKIRSKVMWTSSCSGHRKPNAGTAAKVSYGGSHSSGDASSSLSSSRSGISSGRSLRYANRVKGASVLVAAAVTREPQPPKQQQRAKPAAVASPHLRRRGEAILKLLSLGGSSEVRIRQMLGDSPDTSKALRMLLKVDAVKRSGSGGRHDPYVYTITG